MCLIAAILTLVLFQVDIVGVTSIISLCHRDLVEQVSIMEARQGEFVQNFECDV
jgi:hypothetical protein